ncbi:MAG: FG-GAP-like repeat-containing protein, partial [Candidatus Hydrogenedentota bacterium]
MDSEAESREGLSITHRIPRVHVFEHKGHKNKAVGLVGRRGVTFHYGEEWKEKRGHRLDDRLDDFWETQTALEDINGDGYPDLMVTDTKGTADIEVRVQVFLANKELQYAKKPSFEMTSTGGFLVPRLVDLNGDEKLDLVMLSFPITLRNIANYLFRKKITMRLNTRLFKNGAIPEKETFSNSLSLDVSTDQEESVHIYGDFNADGINELAAGTNKSTLTIAAITKSGALTKKPWATVDVHSFGVARTKDLDNSGTDDLMIIHPRGTYKNDIDIIRF